MQAYLETKCPQYQMVFDWLFNRRFRNNSFFSNHPNTLVNNGHYDIGYNKWSFNQYSFRNNYFTKTKNEFITSY